MKMAVYRQRRDMLEFEHDTCIRSAGSEDDVTLILRSMELEKPVLIGLDGQQTIVKPRKPGDEAHTFDTLLDTCLSAMDLRAMEEAQVTSPEEVPLHRYRLDLTVSLAHLTGLDFSLMIHGRNHGHARSTLRELVNTNADFLREFSENLALAIVSQLPGLVYQTRQATEVEPLPASAETPKWEFISPEC